MPALFKYLSDKVNPNLPTRQSDAPVQTQRRAILPVFDGISGSYNTTLILGTCILGGYIIMRGVSTIFGEYIDEGQFVDLIKNGEIEQLKEIRNGWTFAYLGLWLILIVGGIFVQCRIYKKSITN